MIVFKKFGKTIKIRNNDWKKLKARFNPENAVLDSNEEFYRIERKCPFCYRYTCFECPLHVFGEEYGCFSFLEQLFRGGVVFNHGSMVKVIWDEEDDKKARQQLNRLQRMMDKIEASQGRKDAAK